jgi:hypothetical protein
MRRLRTTRAAGIAALFAALALAGCSGARDTGEGRRIEALVKRFALAHGPDACDLLTTKALVKLYARGRGTLAAGRAGCIARSRRFEGQRVDVTFVKFRTAHSAHATARTGGGRRFYSVGVEKHHGRWLVDSVSSIARPG